MIRKINSKFSNKFLIVAICLAVALFGLNANALTIEKALANPEQEDRAQNLFREIKCLVCEGQAIHDSDSEFARSMRSTIRGQIENNKTDEEVLKFIEKTYSDDIFLKPPFKEETILIWFAPFIILVFGIFFLFRILRRQESFTQ